MNENQNDIDQKDKQVALKGAWFAILLNLLIIAGIVGILISISKLKDKADEDKQKLETAKVETTRTNVKITNVTKMNIKEQITLPGIIEAYDKITLGAEVAGRIEWIGVEEGANVTAGESLFKIDLRTLESNLKQAESNLKQAESSVDQANGFLSQAKSALHIAQLTLDRKKSLFEQKNISEQDYDQAKAQWEAAQASLEQADAGVVRSKAAVLTAQAALEFAKIQLTKGEVKAPFSGVLNRLVLKVGEYANIGMPLAELVKVNLVKAVVAIPEKDIAFVREGTKMDVFIDACVEQNQSAPLAQTPREENKNFPVLSKGGVVYEVPVTYISAIGENLTRTYRAELTISNPDNTIKPGMVIRSTFTRRKINDTIAIPLSAIIPKSGQYYVYVENNGKAERREVVLGVREFDPLRAVTDDESLKALAQQYSAMLSNGDHLMVVGQSDPARAFIVGTRIQILKGLKPNERLIIQGQHNLEDGYPVTIVDGQKPE